MNNIIIYDEIQKLNDPIKRIIKMDVVTKDTIIATGVFNASQGQYYEEAITIVDVPFPVVDSAKCKIKATGVYVETVGNYKQDAKAFMPTPGDYLPLYSQPKLQDGYTFRNSLLYVTFERVKLLATIGTGTSDLAYYSSAYATPNGWVRRVTPFTGATVITDYLSSSQLTFNKTVSIEIIEYK